jgi:hypothetical protein
MKINCAGIFDSKIPLNTSPTLAIPNSDFQVLEKKSFESTETKGTLVNQICVINNIITFRKA